MRNARASVEEQYVQERYHVRCRIRAPDVLAGLEARQHLLRDLYLLLLVLVGRAALDLGDGLQVVLHPLDVLQPQLVVDDLQVLDRVHPVLRVHHVRVLISQIRKPIDILIVLHVVVDDLQILHRDHAVLHVHHVRVGT